MPDAASGMQMVLDAGVDGHFDGNVLGDAAGMQGNPDVAADAAAVGPIAGDTFASPLGSDMNNTCATESAPCLTVAKAAMQAASGATVWLAPGMFAAETVNVPMGLTIRGRTPGMTSLQGRLNLVGGRIADVTLVQTPSNNGSVIDVTAGTVELEGVQWKGSYPVAPGLKASGASVVTLRPGAVTNYISDGTANAQGAMVVVSDTAQVTMIGGTWDGQGLGGGDGQGLLRNGYGAAFYIYGNGKLRAEGVTFAVNTRGIAVAGEASVELIGCTINARSQGGRGYGVLLFNSKGAGRLLAVDTTIRGFSWLGSGAIFFDDDGAPSTATATLINVTLADSTDGINVSAQSTAVVRATNLKITNNLFSGVFCGGTCDLDIAGGTVSGNAGYNPTPFGYNGGISLGTPQPHKLKLRNVAVTNNRNTTVDGNTNSAGNSGVTLAGTAASVFDLGTTVSPGGNTFTGNDTGSETTGINVRAAAGVVVSAVGNTFAAGMQGADAQGKYVIGTAPCAASPCLVTSGGGGNYRVTSGSLRLAE